MAFPSNPSHLAPALVNGVNYVYDSNTVSWSPQSSTNTLTIGSLATFSVSGNASVLGTFGIGTASPTQALSVNGSIGGTILYDYNDTGYYVDPNVTSNMYTAIFRNTAYSYGWWRSYNQSGWYNETYAGGVWMTDSTYVRVYNGKSFLVESAAHMRIGAGEANEKQLWFSNDSGLIYFFQQTVANGGGFGLWDSTGSKTRWYTDTAGNFSNSYSIRAPIFYDTDNTNYYLNPAGYSVLAEIPVGNNGAATYDGISDMNSLTQKSGWYLYNTPSNGPFATWTTWMTTMGHYSGDRYGFQLAKNYWGDDFRVRGITNNTWQTWRKLPLYDVNSSGTLYATDFIDNNDTSYHCDPTGTSVLNSLSTTGLYYTRTNDAAFNAANDTTLSIRGNASYPATMSFHRTGAYAINVGLDTDNYFSIGGWSASTIKHKFAMDGNYWTSLWSDWLTNQWRSNIFYDNDDTYYRIDPNGQSQLSYVKANNWFRGQGQTGLYSESYGQHIYPTTDGRLWNFTTSGQTSGGLRILKTYEGEVRGYLYWDGDENFGLLHKNGGWNYRGWTDGFEAYGYWHYQTRIQAYIYYDRDDTGYYCDPNGYSSMSSMRLWGNNLYIRGGSPTIFFQDVDHYSAMIHNNSHLLYILRGGVDSTTWATTGPSNWWPCYWDLTNNNCVMGGYFTNAYDIYYWASDARLKENVVEITNAIDKIKQIRGVTFDWNDTADAAGFRPVERYNNVGVIAQEIQAVLPQAIKPAPFDKWVPDPGEHYSDEVLAANTNTSRTGEDYLTVQMEKIIPLLIQAIKEQQTQIENLQSRLDQINP